MLRGKFALNACMIKEELFEVKTNKQTKFIHGESRKKKRVN